MAGAGDGAIVIDFVRMPFLLVPMGVSDGRHSSAGAGEGVTETVLSILRMFFLLEPLFMVCSGDAIMTLRFPLPLSEGAVVVVVCTCCRVEVRGMGGIRSVVGAVVSACAGVSLAAATGVSLAAVAAAGGGGFVGEAEIGARGRCV